jgi:hypothetical protein
MPLRVIRYVHQQSAQCRRQSFLPDHAFHAQISRCQRPHAFSATRKGPFNLSEQCVTTHLRIPLAFQRRNLRLSQLPFFRIGQQPVHTPRDVPQMKCNGRQSARARFQLLLCQRSAPFSQILLRQLQRVQNSPVYRRDVPQRPAQPWFRHQNPRFAHVAPPISKEHLPMN